MAKLFNKNIVSNINSDDEIVVKDAITGKEVIVKASNIIDQLFDTSNLGNNCITYNQDITEDCESGITETLPIKIIDVLLRHEELLCDAISVSDEIQNTCCDGNNPISEFYSFQFDSLTNDISNVSLIDDTFINQETNIVSSNDIFNGIELQFTTVGRIGFIVRTDTVDNYNIYDELNNEISIESFDSYYDVIREIQIYITKEYYTPNFIHFRFEEK